MIMITTQEIFDKTGIDLNTELPPDADSKHAYRFIDYICRVVDSFLRKHSPGLFKRGYDKLNEYQINVIKDACINYANYVFNTGAIFIDPNTGLPKKIPIDEDTIDILRPVTYRGI